MGVPDTLTRSEQRLGVICAQIIFGPLCMIGPAAAGIGVAIFEQFSAESLFLLAFGVFASVFFAGFMLPSYQWVELDRNTLRGQRFWTRQWVEQDVSDISEIVPLIAPIKSIPTRVTDKLLGSARGYEIGFRDGSQPIGLIRHDMTNVDGLIEAIRSRLVQDAPHGQ